MHLNYKNIIMNLLRTNFHQLRIRLSEKKRIEDPMGRRSLLKSLLFGTGVATIGVNAAPATAQSNSVKVKVPATPYIQTPDGTKLFYQDWGTGRPIVFVAPLGA